MNPGSLFRATMALAVTLCCLTACEKHDGTDYFKSKCMAELNGQKYIDQTPVAYIFSPAAQKTPAFDYDDDSARFTTNLRTKRGGPIVYCVEINLYAETAGEILHKEQTIERADMEYPDGKPSNLDYIIHCIDKRIPYATINGDVADQGSFKITSYDTEKGVCDGIFSLTFDEGTLTGEFSL